MTDRDALSLHALEGEREAGSTRTSGRTPTSAADGLRLEALAPQQLVDGCLQLRPRLLLELDLLRLPACVDAGHRRDAARRLRQVGLERQPLEVQGRPRDDVHVVGRQPDEAAQA